MKVSVSYIVGVLALAACGSQNTYNLPGSSITAPNALELNPASRSDASMASTGARVGARNEGTQVWLVPAPAGDLLRLKRNSELWPKAQKRVDVLGLYFLEAYNHPGFECGTPCGPNTYQALLQEDFFRWASERFMLSMEAGSVKPFSCTPETLAPIILYTNIALANVKKAGGMITYIALDEPFAAGTGNAERSQFGSGGCGLSAGQVALLQKQFNDGIHQQNPEVQIGLIEPYPYLTVDEIMSDLLELERVGIDLPFFRIDLDIPAAVRAKKDWNQDVRRLREFCRSRGIPFAVILWGTDGRSNEQFATGHWSLARAVFQAVGVTEHTVLQSWAEDPPGQLNSLKHSPDTVPESNPSTHTGLLLATLEYFGIRPSME